MNVVRFPVERRGVGSSIDHKELVTDLLAIANYFDACATNAEDPQWMRCMASEVRREARKIG